MVHSFGLSIRLTESDQFQPGRLRKRLSQSRRTEIVQVSRRRVISVSVFVLLLEFK